MNEWQDRLDGIQLWFYGGEPGVDDLPLEDETASPAPADDAQASLHLCNACAQQALPR
jgi:hypothetical protein